jgi:tRNA U54 and U55 pseudouridine synthase Pus10
MPLVFVISVVMQKLVRQNIQQKTLQRISQKQAALRLRQTVAQQRIPLKQMTLRQTMAQQ